MPDNKYERLSVGLDQDIAEARTRIANAEREMTQSKAWLKELLDKKRVLDELGRTYGDDDALDNPQPTAPVTEDWTAMKRMQAVERVMRELKRVVHLNDVMRELQSHGRSAELDHQAAISMTLSHLKRRGICESLGNGLWEYTEPKKESEASIISMEDRMG